MQSLPNNFINIRHHKFHFNDRSATFVRVNMVIAMNVVNLFRQIQDQFSS